jgi:hypothetical protein
LDHQRALKHSQAFNESVGRRKAEFELNKAIRIVRETENSYGGQIGNLRERIMMASDELQRSVEERSIMQSKLQNAQQRIDLLNSQLKEVEVSRFELERQKSNDTKFERIKIELESEIRSMRRQLEQAKECEKALHETVNRVEGRGDHSRREIMELERELRILRTENALLQSKLATKGGATVSRTKPTASTVTGTPIIPYIPVINVPNPNSQRQQAIPLEILVDSPVERRNTKRLSSSNKTSSPVKRAKSESAAVSETPGGLTNKTTTTVMSTPAAATPSNFMATIPGSNENINGSGLTSLLEGVGKKKIKLPERSAKITITSSQNSQSEIPRSTPIGKGPVTDPSVMDSIMSSFTVKFPTIKK